MIALARATETESTGQNKPLVWDSVRLSALLAAMAERQPGGLAFSDQPDRGSWSGRPRISWTYANAQHIVERLAAFLSNLGLSPGAPVAICMPNGAEACASILAVERAGLLPCLLPIGWSEEALGRALEIAQVEAVICQGRIAEEEPAQMFCRLAARYFGIRFVCAFGPLIPDGVLDLDRAILDTAASIAPAEPAGHAGLVTFEDREGEQRPIFRPYNSCLAAAIAFLVAHRVAAGDRIVSLLAQDDHRGLTTGLVAALASGATFEGHGLFDSDALAATCRREGAVHLVAPGFLETALAKSALADALASVVLVHNAPVRFKSRGDLRGRVTDVLGFGERALIAAPRSETGRWALSIEEIFGSEHPSRSFIEARRVEGDAIEFAGSAAETYDFAWGTADIPAEKPHWRPSGFKVELFAGTVIGIR